MSPGYTVEQTARLLAALRWIAGRCSAIVAAWAADAAADSPEAAVWLASLGRRLDSHCGVLASHQPDSVLMASLGSPRPPDQPVAAALDEIAALAGAPARLAAARQVLIPQLVAALAEVCAHAAPHCDAALASAAETLSRDLSRHAAAGDGLTEADSGAVARVRRQLQAAGGMVGYRLLRPAVDRI